MERVEKTLLVVWENEGKKEVGGRERENQFKLLRTYTTQILAQRPGSGIHLWSHTECRMRDMVIFFFNVGNANVSIQSMVKIQFWVLSFLKDSTFIII